MAEFDWNDLRSFLAVARTGRLTAAAARRGLDHSTLSRRVAALKSRHPQLMIQLVAAPAVFSLARRDADVAISPSRPPAGRLNVSRLTDYDLALYAAPLYLAQAPEIHALADLTHHRFVS